MRLVMASMISALAASGFALAADVEAAIKQFTNIPSQPLASALEVLATQRNIQVLYRSDIVGAMQAPRVTGELTTNEVLQQLLRGTGLSFQYLEDGAVMVAPLDATPVSGAKRTGANFTVPAAELATKQSVRLAQAGGSSDESSTPRTAVEPIEQITVTASRPQLYSSQVVTSGVLGDKDPIDIPFSISSYTSELAKLQAASTPAEILKNDPAAQISGNFIGFQNNVIVRGFAARRGGVRRDGLIANHEGDFPIETFDRVELVKGVAGFLYGFAEPGGTLNFVTKRPTLDGFAEINLRMQEGSGPYAHLDAGGPIGEGRFGYRVNLVYQDADDYTHPGDVHREAASLAFDARLSDSLLLRFDGSYQFREQPGVLGLPLTTAGSIPPEYDSNRRLVPLWLLMDWKSSHAGLGLEYTLSENWKLLVQSGYEKLGTNTTFGNINRLEPNGDFNELLFYVNPRNEVRYDETSVQLLALGKVTTGPVQHDLAIGAFRRKQDYEMFSPTGNGTVTITGNLFDLAFPDRPAIYAGPRARADRTITTETHLFLGDTLHLSEHWQVLLGARHVDYEADLLTGADESAHELSPSGALLYKPTDSTTLYGSYARSLQYGTRSPCGVGVVVTNPCELQPPLQAKQYEVGAKMRLQSALELGVALYRIEVPSDYIDPSTLTYGRFGEQVNQGVELSAVGNVMPNLAVVAGLGYLDAKYTRNLNPALNGNRVAGLSKLTANLFLNYGVTALPGLSLNAGVYRAGSRYFNQQNTIPVDGYVRTDVGAQYRLRAFSHPITVGASVNNVFDKFYWEGLGPYGRAFTAGVGRMYVISFQAGLY